MKKTISILIVLFFLVCASATAKMQIEFAEGVNEAETFPLEVLCQGGTGQNHVMYVCVVDEFHYGEKPTPDMCKPVIPGLPPFQYGERAICPIDGTSAVDSDLPEARFGIFGEEMDILTSKGWMPRKTRKRIST